MIKNLENEARKPVEPKPSEILLRNLDRMRDPDTIVNYAIANYGDSMMISLGEGHGKRHTFAIMALLCDYYEYANPSRFGKEFGNYYERHLKGTVTPRDSLRSILKRHFSRENAPD